MDEYFYLKLLILYRNLQLIGKRNLHVSDKTGQYFDKLKEKVGEIFQPTF